MADQTRTRLGEQLRELRQRRGWTLREVSARSGLAVSTLSKVENDQMSLTYDKLLELAEGLDVGIAELFAPIERYTMVTARRAVAPPGHGVAQKTANYDYLYLCTELANKRMVPIIATIRAHSIEGFGPLVRHAGEEFIYVLEGSIDVHTEFYEPVHLDTRGSIYLDSTMGHAYLAAGAESAVVLAVCSSAEPGFDKRLPDLMDGNGHRKPSEEKKIDLKRNKLNGMPDGSV